MLLRSVLRFNNLASNRIAPYIFRPENYRQYIRAFHQNPKRNGFPRLNRQILRRWYTTAGILTCGYLLADYAGVTRKLKISSIAASTELSGRRSTRGFMADVADLTAPAVVYLDLRDGTKVNHLTGDNASISGGSGFLVRSDGLIVTSAHVIVQQISQKNVKIFAKLVDGRSFEAKVERVDRNLDLAALRIPVASVPVLNLGRSATIKPGEFVLALGSPLALSNTVTCGIFSAFRKAQEIGQTGDTVYLQTDASINNGNSGGPLVNIEGEVVGVNAMSLIPGISFATPVDLVRTFLGDLLDVQSHSHKEEFSDSKKTRYVGITMLTLTKGILDELVNSHSLEISQKVKFGVWIQSVAPDSPAETGGLNPGDIVTHINGKEVKNSSDIYDVLGEKGKNLDMTVFRGLKQLRIVVKPEE